MKINLFKKKKYGFEKPVKVSKPTTSTEKHLDAKIDYLLIQKDTLNTYEAESYGPIYGGKIQLQKIKRASFMVLGDYTADDSNFRSLASRCGVRIDSANKCLVISGSYYSFIKMINKCFEYKISNPIIQYATKIVCSADAGMYLDFQYSDSLDESLFGSPVIPDIVETTADINDIPKEVKDNIEFIEIGLDKASTLKKYFMITSDYIITSREIIFEVSVADMNNMLKYLYPKFPDQINELFDACDLSSYGLSLDPVEGDIEQQPKEDPNAAVEVIEYTD